MDYFELSNGIKVPNIGFGTSLIEGNECVINIQQALKAGYRHIDTAAAYDNEEYIGQAIKKSNLPRDEIFITSKVWKDSMGYKNTIEAFEKSINRLGVEYIDLYLIHWPKNDNIQINIDTWKALEKLYKDGRVRAIGVSNFLKYHLELIMEKCEIMPMVDQLEIHPGLTRKETVDFCKKNDIIVEAWAPLGKGKMMQNDELIKIANKYKKSVPQICIRWCLQNDIIPLPKTSNYIRMIENISVFDFQISKNDMDFITNMKYFAGSNMDPNKS